MEISQISVGLAFLAGLASFLSPCVFSLVPAYVGYLGGRAAGGDGQSNRWVTFSHGVAFVLGFSVVFVLLGMTMVALFSPSYGTTFSSVQRSLDGTDRVRNRGQFVGGRGAGLAGQPGLKKLHV